VTSKPDFKVMVLLLVFMQLTRDLFAIAKFLSFPLRAMEVWCGTKVCSVLIKGGEGWPDPFLVFPTQIITKNAGIETH